MKPKRPFRRHNKLHCWQILFRAFQTFFWSNRSMWLIWLVKFTHTYSCRACVLCTRVPMHASNREFIISSTHHATKKVTPLLDGLGITISKTFIIANCGDGITQWHTIPSHLDAMRGKNVDKVEKPNWMTSVW